MSRAWGAKKKEGEANADEAAAEPIRGDNGGMGIEFGGADAGEKNGASAGCNSVRNENK